MVHLDFHTSPSIGDVGIDFDAPALARTFREARVESVTVFAKCHHGMCYYPTRHGRAHPALKGRDLLGETIEALHREGIRCPIYTTVAWEEEAAHTHPEWRQLDRDGISLRSNATLQPQPGPWHFLNFVHPGYQDYIEAHVRELLDGYEVDGMFFDILMMHPKGCWSDESLRFRRRHNLLSDDAATWVAFETAAQCDFARRFTRLVQGAHPKATVFYNAPNNLYVTRKAGAPARAPFQSHFEVESLPSGFWGYYHFPRVARHLAGLNRPWFGHTGKFQKMWGDFGGLKPAPALEYECFRMQALGGGCGVGDQLPPRGRPDPATYRLIGDVFRQCEAAEPFYEGSTAMPQVGVISPHYPGNDETTTAKSEEGCVLLLEESHYDAAIVDEDHDLGGFPLLMLPDSVVVSPKLRRKLQAYHRSGGTLLLSHRSGFDASGRWGLGFLPFQPQGETDMFPTYWRNRDNFVPEMLDGDRVIYERGLNIRPGRGTTVLIDRILPYFQRTDAHFCSHFQTPPVAHAAPHPAVIGGLRFIYFADPVFRDYRQTGNTAVKAVWRKAIERLIRLPPFGDGLASSILCVPRRRNRDLLLTLLHYIPVRKALDIDVIDERISFSGQILRLPPRVREVRVFPEGKPLKKVQGGFALPEAQGRLLLEIPGFFPRD